MIHGTDFYAWNPNYFQFRNPETGKFFGNVIGNFSLEDQLKIVDDEGARQKANIRAIGEEQILAIRMLASKFVRFWEIADEVERAITGIIPSQRNDGSDFIEEFLENYIPLVNDESVSENPVETEEGNEASFSGAEYYTWRPNYFQARDPETAKFFGNVIGNVPSQEQIWTVSNAGAMQKEEILEVGSAETEDIMQMSEKFRRATKINKDTMKELIAFFGGVFVLDSSMLDGSPLG